MSGRHVADPSRESVRAEAFARLSAQVWYAGGLKLRGRHAVQDSPSRAALRVTRAENTYKGVAA